ncbi:MAG: 16S rRNA (guanine(966)-N(2))-methyltransferase RsmD [Legionellaceae bacterium]|nr:16S rRNA (guanine(966)-N(2))-methyltransferase RsmD [Legionellaceae bacterium]
MKQEVRIIGGHHRGKKITFPDALGLRPTPSRIRETLFNWLMHTVRGARCLDAFAGSGALGFEAWSRGASSVTLLEQSRTTSQHLKKQAMAFDANILQVIHTDAISYLKNQAPNSSFDLVFLDPPFGKPQLLLDSITCLEQSSALRLGGLLYTESSEALTLNPALWETLKFKKAGTVIYGLHQKRENNTCASTSSDPVA